MDKNNSPCFFSFLLVLICSFVSLISNANNTINCIVQTNTERHSFIITPNFNIKFNNSSIDFRIDKELVLNVPQESFLSISYRCDDNSSLIDNVTTPPIEISVYDKKLHICCNVDKLNLILFDIKGNVLFQKDLDAFDDYTLDLSNLESGIFFLHINKKTYKIFISK